MWKNKFVFDVGCQSDKWNFVFYFKIFPWLQKFMNILLEDQTSVIKAFDFCLLHSPKLNFVYSS